MEAAAPEGAEPGSGGSGAEEPVVSLAEVLAENEELEKEARAVLGGSDHERCSYSQGAVKRQALYACSTCTPPGAEPAGICLACSYECHGTHRLFELYTKRNFRCDCGNSKFKNLQCKLLPEKGKVNSGNKYNDNFYGLYCTCKRPYPDPEDEIPDEMIQCVVCEDWFHGRHLGAVPPESGDFHEMVCQACMKRCHFLWAYASQLAVPPLTKASSLEDEGIVLKVEESEEQKKEIKKEGGVEHHDTKEEKQSEQFSEPSTSSGSACPEVVTKSEEPICKLKELQSKPFVKKDTATFWPSNWRSKLCTCEDCLKMYSELEVQFLTDECDTVLAYENKGTSDQETERRDPLMDTLNSMNRVQQVELICEYNDLKTELTDYLRRFADEGTVVKREDIQHFFEEFQSRKRRRTNRMQYYCS
ncbi:putative E3 ubiquitin-protein ligase UBR7 [Melozone crissalis]|uniref:putative E3 ubiquitin-protein ligase UBR7 n=1 Tax=Melozone crissalis TaxID=40204 RepID=UPI0023DC6DCF|nr:putative E3 ubiquitin-protein ligase UBR7 [Melozone crissalis]